MHFLVDASLPSSTATLISSLGHTGTDVRDIGLGDADDEDIAAYAQERRDFDFADVRNYPPAEYAGIAVVDLPNDWLVASILQVIRGFVIQEELLDKLPGHLAIIEAGRIRLR
jgi:predicted nuclease of predicted toxin-antitoxin system